jgi:hypothetical protein
MPRPRSAQAQAEIVEQTQAHAETINHRATTKSTEERGELWRTENREQRGEHREGKKMEERERNRAK